MNAPRELGGALRFAALAAAGACLALLLVWAATGVLHGFAGQTRFVARALQRQALWLVPAAAALGALLRAYYAALLAAPAGGDGGLLLLSVPRMFVHFMAFGLLALLGAVLGALLSILGAVLLKRRDAEGAPTLFERWLGIPIWFVLLPAAITGRLGQSEGDMRLPVTVSRRVLLRWLPWVCLAAMLWVNSRGEDGYGRRIDPRVVAALAAFWLGDYLIVLAEVAPVLRARRGLAP